MNTVDEQKVACHVCNGKGGFRKPKQNFLDSNWMDCAYCEGYGFVVDNTTEEDAKGFLTYNRYRNKLLGEFQKLGDIHLLTTENVGKDLYIKISPFNRPDWVELVKYLLKFSHHSSKVDILPKQAFYIEGESNKIYWELHITTQELHDLDGVLDVVTMYNDTLEVKNARG